MRTAFIFAIYISDCIENANCVDENKPFCDKAGGHFCVGMCIYHFGKKSYV